MISKSPERISYVSISTSIVEGETIEKKTTIDNIRCSFQQGTNNYKTNVNGSDVVYRNFISITEITEISKVPTFNINDVIIFEGKEYKVLVARKRQMHIEIYV